MSGFISGLELAGLFYSEAVSPLLESTLPGLPHAAALIGSGSEILGFDTEVSTDHHWGPRVMLFLSEEDYARHREAIVETLRNSLPRHFGGYPTNFTLPNPNDNNTQRLQDTETGPINHRVEVLTVRGFLLDYLGFDIRNVIEPADWLTFPEQKLLTVTAGAVYHDEIGLHAVRDRLSYYPHDVWLYLLACGWARVGQEEHLMGRAGSAGDELGSSIIGSRLVRDLMRLCFLMEKQYAPYAKWFGTAFSRLKCGKDLSPILRRALLAENWQEREKDLSAAYEYVARLHNQLGITDPLPARVATFFGRPFLTIELGGNFADEIRKRISDPAVERIALKPPIGGIDLFSDSTDLLSEPHWRTVVRKLYD